MAKKSKSSGVVHTTNHIAGDRGCGPLMAREIMAGSKAMSRKHGKLETKPGSFGGGASVVKATNHIAGTPGKGPFRASEVMSGDRPMNRSHGVVPKNRNTNMDVNTGGYRIGAGCRTFRRGLLGPQGGGQGAGHKTQSKGHKSGFNT